MSFNTDQFGRITCDLTDGDAFAVVTSSRREDATESLRQAIESLASRGSGECFWPESVGDYRWAFRREGDLVRVAVMWSTGTVTGWEHVFWTECGAEHFIALMREELQAVGSRRSL